METISNEEKAEQIAQYHCANKLNLIQAYNSALDMAEWKDEQHAKEKQQWIEKVTDFISKHFYISTSNHVISKKDYYSLTELIRDINQAMEE